LARLSAGQRQIIVLRDYMDLSYAEIADVLEIAQGTVMSQLHRARIALKEELGHD
jgi:RNA polymerase sigma-70 factor (ECF subfamily)